MPMHTNSYDDKDGRALMTRIYESEGFSVFNPNFNTGKVGDLFVFDHDGGFWFIVEVEEMGSKSARYVDEMKRYALGEEEPKGMWKGGLTIPARKFEYTDRDRRISNKIRKMLNMTHEGDLTWDLYARITPDKDGIFLAQREDVDGKVDGLVETERHTMTEARPSVSWENVRYVDLT